MKRYLIAAALLLASVSARALPITSGLGKQTFVMSLSTPAATAVQLAVGAASLVTVKLDSATAAGDFCDFVDSGSTSGITTGDNTTSAPHVVSLQAAATNTTYEYAIAAANAVPFTNGIVAICTKAVRLTGLINQ